MAATLELQDALQDRPALATVLEGAEFLNISRSSVYARMDAGDIRYVRIGRCRRIPWEELERVARVGTDA